MEHKCGADLSEVGTVCKVCKKVVDMPLWSFLPVDLQKHIVQLNPAEYNVVMRPTFSCKLPGAGVYFHGNNFNDMIEIVIYKTKLGIEQRKFSTATAADNITLRMKQVPTNKERLRDDIKKFIASYHNPQRHFAIQILHWHIHSQTHEPLFRIVVEPERIIWSTFDDTRDAHYFPYYKYYSCFVKLLKMLYKTAWSEDFDA